MKLRWLGPFLLARVPSHFPPTILYLIFLSQSMVKSAATLFFDFFASAKDLSTCGFFFAFFTSAWTCLMARSLLIR